VNRLFLAKWAWLVVISAVTLPAPAQTFNVLLSFGENAYRPLWMSLIQGQDGYFYGTTSQSPSKQGVYCFLNGAAGCGTVFKVDREGVLTVLYEFCTGPHCPDGAQPDGGLVLAHDGNFYGTTGAGGLYGYGTIFKITPQGILTRLYSFCGQDQCSDGAYPVGSLIEGLDGNLFGTTTQGGNSGPPYGCGTVFTINTKGTLTTLHKFVNRGDGCVPFENLIQASDGNFYGTTAGGGSAGEGAVYKMTPQGTVTTLYSFCASDPYCPDGQNPEAGLIEANDGRLYGTTTYGGNGGNGGTVFRINTKGTLETLHTFCREKGCSDGKQPVGGLIQATDSSLYGTTYAGGPTTCDGGNGCGTIFKISADGTFSILHLLSTSEGGGPEGSLFQGTNGVLYGTTSQGLGTLFTEDMGLEPFVLFVRRVGRVGQTGGILGQGFTGASAVSFNGTPANFTVSSDTFITATVPQGATSGYVTVTTPNGVLQSNVPFRVIP